MLQAQSKTGCNSRYDSGNSVGLSAHSQQRVKIGWQTEKLCFYSEGLLLFLFFLTPVMFTCSCCSYNMKFLVGAVLSSIPTNANCNKNKRVCLIRPLFQTVLVKAGFIRNILQQV